MREVSMYEPDLCPCQQPSLQLTIERVKAVLSENVEKFSLSVAFVDDDILKSFKCLLVGLGSCMAGPFFDELLLHQIEDALQVLFLCLLQIDYCLETVVDEFKHRVTVAFPEEGDIVVVDVDAEEELDSAGCVHVLVLEFLEDYSPEMCENLGFRKEAEAVVTCVDLHLNNTFRMIKHLVLHEPDVRVVPC